MNERGDDIHRALLSKGYRMEELGSGVRRYPWTMNEKVSWFLFPSGFLHYGIKPETSHVASVDMVDSLLT